MVLGMKKKTDKVVMRNAAVQAVGEKYFQVALIGLAAAGLLAIAAASIGELFLEAAIAFLVDNSLFKFQIQGHGRQSAGTPVTLAEVL